MYRIHSVLSTCSKPLAEFGSVSDAVQCAVEVQQELAERNKALPEERKMVFRIGVKYVLEGFIQKSGERVRVTYQFRTPGNANKIY